MKKYKYILFDMDGTVVNSNIKAFLENYVKELFEIYQKNISNHKSFDYFRQAFDKCWQLTKEKDGKESIEEFFCLKLLDELKIDYSATYNIFAIWNKTYAQFFGPYGEKMPFMIQSIKYLQAKNIDFGLATNPYFSLEMINSRLSWGDLSISDFKFISTCDIIHYAKPNVQFYSECCDKVGIQKEDVLFVGNDTVHDANCEKIGIDCYLITDNLCERNGVKANSKYIGDSKKFLEFVKKNF